MSEPRPPDAPDSTAYHPSSGEPPPQTVAHGEAVYPEGMEASDDAPTIISKKIPSRNTVGSSAESIVSGSLRGRSLAHFELIEPIGVGGMAAVIRARDRQLDRPVALKILPPEMASDPENVRRFHQEARAAAKLDHENIARVFFCGEDQRLHFIAFEFVEGVNLRTLLEKRGRIPVHEAVHYMLQIATGLAHAALRGVVHRDIKPSNIIISPNGRAKLVDMGLARNTGPQSDRDLTQSGVTLGTFDYIAPEQAMDPREADVRSDIYSLGCTFYHMLTGQPPVPEGTAAKKLHHHQHIAPVDPRQLNPSIPDDVAAILQRMMAKEPKDRYQRAEYLVQHLIQVAQKLGTVADVPDGVLFVDAPLPAPPSKRPLLVTAVGVLLLGLLLIALSLAPGPSGSLRLPGPQVNADFRSVKVSEGPKAQDKAKTDTRPVEKDPQPVKNESELNAAIAQEQPLLTVLLEENLRIRSGVKFAGTAERTLVVRPREPREPVTIRISPDLSATRREPSWSGIEIDGATVVFQDLVFDLDLGTDAFTPETLVAAILVKGGGKATFERCVFTQRGVRMEALMKPDRLSLVPVASVAVWNPGRSATDRAGLTFKECFFKRGQAAVSVFGNAEVRPISCAFGPHVTLFHLRGEEKPELGTAFDLRHVSALLVYGPAFRLDRGAGCDIKVEQSIFSCPKRQSDAYDLPDLIRQTSTKTGSVHYNGVRNCYHNLNAFWSRTTPSRGQPDTWDIFLAEVRRRGGSESSSSCLTTEEESPWAERGNLMTYAQESPRAFQVDPKRVEVRQSNTSRLPIGVQKCAGVDVAEELSPLVVATVSPPAQTPNRKPNEKVVDPNSASEAPGVFRTLAGAVTEAKDGDVILIKYTGPIPVDAVSLKVGQKLKIRPEGEHRPILVLRDKAVSTEALFTVYNGELNFEDLQFLLKPNRSNSLKPQAVVALKGNGQCLFKKCVFTAERPEEGDWAPQCLVALSQDREAMTMTPPEPGTMPGITVEKCFLRGDADLLTVRTSRPFLLDVSCSLVALSGSLVSVEANAAEPMVAGGLTADIRLTGTTTYLENYLISLRGKTSKGLVYTQVTADNCLFVAAAKRALVHIEGPDGDDQMRKVFGWTGRAGKGSKGNTYAGFDTLLEHFAGEGSPKHHMDQERWKTFASETDPEARFPPLKFALPPGDRGFSQVMPDQFRPKNTMPGSMDYSDCGATLNQIPSPSIVEASRPARPAVSVEQPGDEADNTK